MTTDEKKLLAMALARLGLLKGRELTAPAIGAYTDALSAYELPEVLAAIDGAARTPGFLELASITTLLDGDPQTEALLAWTGQGGDFEIKRTVRKAVGLDQPGLFERDVKWLRKPFLETYTALLKRKLHAQRVHHATAAIQRNAEARKIGGQS
jgi:hypothetical protein